MGDISKKVDELTPEDLEAYPIWEYDLDNESDPKRDETWVRPIKVLPVIDLENKVIGTFMTLNNGMRFPALLGNVDLKSIESTKEFLTVSLWHRGKWLDLARYFDVDYNERGPSNLAYQLDMTINEVFPMRYDISTQIKGLASVIQGVVEAEPKHRLSNNERMALIFGSYKSN
jgi:hypothetical protein